jgi:hypothetical protein
VECLILVTPHQGSPGTRPGLPCHSKLEAGMGPSTTPPLYPLLSAILIIQRFPQRVLADLKPTSSNHEPADMYKPLVTCCTYYTYICHPLKEQCHKIFVTRFSSNNLKFSFKYSWKNRVFNGLPNVFTNGESILLDVFTIRESCSPIIYHRGIETPR